ncbi:MAG: hypothetical protein IPP74_15125 [Alphaproteobacteria bacterium]|jgi:hypothetical protein|nr:hypothetical protein [Alphaproteobacteria bacterium]
MNWSDEIRDNILQLRADALSGGTITFYTPPKPSIGAAITTQTTLIEIEIPTGLTAASNLLSVTLPATAVLADGVANWGRINDSSHAFVADGTCGNKISSADFRFRDTTLVAGAMLTNVTCTFAEG